MNDQNDDQKSRSNQGFGSMPKSRVQEIGSKGGKATHKNDNQSQNDPDRKDQPLNSSDDLTELEDEETS